MLSNLLVMFSYFLIIFATFISFCMLIGFFRNRDFLVKLHFIKTNNLYAVPLFFLSIAIKDFQVMSFIQVVIFIILNSLMTLCISHAIARIAINTSQEYSFIARKDYDEKQK
ncbi:MAG: hypothetical protein Ta2D_09880 [Rickettsiales bacterium]|nr:MAG: hypothetical protein Ta2D_09880 [Rickettsiales bacterium]